MVSVPRRLGWGRGDGREVERPLSVIPALLLAYAMVSKSFPTSVPLSRALDLFSSSADQGRSCFSLFSASYREALTLAGALITPVVETVSTGETKSYGGR